MKIAEALQERSDLKRKIAQLSDRICDNILVQVGDEPAENPIVLKEDLDSSIIRLKYLIEKINETNCNTIVEGRSLTDIIAEKDTHEL